jgi:hypothetical protein
MKRREFIAGLGSAAAWPVVARAQQRALPVMPLSESDQAALFLEFLRWKQKSAQ